MRHDTAALTRITTPGGQGDPSSNQLQRLDIPREVALPDNDQWQFRFEIRSETSNRIYTIAQHRTRKHWGCSCPGWKRYRTCKHLEAIGLPTHERPFDPKIEYV